MTKPSQRGQGRPPKYRRDIGPEVLAMRRQDPPVPWCLIERKFDMTRVRLWQFMRRAENAERRAGTNVFNKHNRHGQRATLLG